MKTYTKLALGLAACFVTALTAYAIVSIDENGNGFVRKGDVQTAFGWNNATLQDAINNHTWHFSYEGTTVSYTDTTWSCTNENNEMVQERLRTTTTTTTASNPSYGVARVRSQITGFNLTGGTLTSDSSSTTDGPPAGSCPSGPWVFNNDLATSDPVIDPDLSTRTLEICYLGVCHDIALVD